MSLMSRRSVLKLFLGIGVMFGTVASGCKKLFKRTPDHSDREGAQNGNLREELAKQQPKPMWDSNRVKAVEKPLMFPAGFIWGAALSAPQTEGLSPQSDWWEWVERHYPPENRFGNGTGFATRYAEDFKLAKKIGVRMIRISLDWARIEPAEGYIDWSAVTHYRKQILAARAEGLAVMLVAVHFTFPKWIAEKGGCLSPDFPRYFARFMETAVAHIAKDDVAIFATFNEPDIIVANSYVSGVYPPHRRFWTKKEDNADFSQLTRRSDEVKLAQLNLVRAHRAGYGVIHRHYDGRKAVLAGITFFTPYFAPPEPQRNIHDHYTASYIAVLSQFHAESFLDMIDGFQDYIGIDFYHAAEVDWQGGIPGIREGQITYRYFVDPDGLYQIIKRYAALYRLPIFVAENGINTTDDALKARFFWEHSCAVHRAITEGCDVRGFFVWSLTDAREWNGEHTTYGMIRVDFKTLERVILPSAWLFKDVADANALTPEIFERHRNLLETKNPD